MLTALATRTTVLLALLSAAACSRHVPPVASVVPKPPADTAAIGAASASAGVAPAQPPPAAQSVDNGITYAVLINGGGQRQSNFQSHLLHLKGLLPLLEASGVSPERITIFSGDGDDPEVDLATRESNADPRLWLLPDGVVRYARPDIDYVNSTIDGFSLQPARKEALQAWFTNQGSKLGPDDTLLLYVTDHGERNRENTHNNTITLWHEKLSVAELREMLAQLDQRTRVVEVMSQCFSGAFADTMYASDAEATPGGNVCGYFAATADRPAYGCYPENYGKDGVGHSHHLFEALGVLETVPEAQRRVQVTDRTPDVPHTSSDRYLEELLAASASASGRDHDVVVDELLAEAWNNRAEWETEIRLLDRIGATFGCFSPRSLAELRQQSRSLPEFSLQLQTYGQRWSDALDALRVENWQDFLKTHPQWRKQFTKENATKLDAAQRRHLANQVLAELEPFTRSNEARYTRLQLLKKKADDSLDASYRSEVRLGAVLRMRTVLVRIAGQMYLREHGTGSEREAYARLIACENLPLGPPATVTSAAALPAPEAFPTLAQERELVTDVAPAWMGVQYRPVPESQRARFGVPAGAATVMTVFPDSAAETAGLQVGDIVLGPPDAPFTEPHALREWTMRSEIGAATPLAVKRNMETIEVTLYPGPFPLKMPEMPGPPKVGSNAPPLKIEPFRGGERLVEGRSQLLFFWATWCLPCKFALPEVLAFSQARGVEVVAITDEAPEALDKFFQQNGDPFPPLVAVDPLRLTFQSYGVSGTPTFVLIDESGRVQHYKTGYDAKVGLGIDGWHWSPPAKKAAAPNPAPHS